MNKIEFDKLIQSQTEALSEIFVGKVEPIVKILKGHLYTENYLEKIILCKLPRGDKLIDNGSLTYHHKLLICESLNCLPDPLISSLRNLNKIRNKCAHQLDIEITEADIAKIGSPFGKEFTVMKKFYKTNLDKLFSHLIVFICARLAGMTILLEHGEL